MNLEDIQSELELLPTIPPTNETLTFIDKVLLKKELTSNEKYEFAGIVIELIDRLTFNYVHLTEN